MITVGFDRFPYVTGLTPEAMALPVADFLLFAAGAAVFFGLGPILSKRGLARGGTWVGNTLTVIGVRATMFWVVLLLVAGGGALTGLTAFGALIFAAAGISASGIGRLSFYVGVDKVGSSLSAAVANARPLFAVLLGAFWLGEVVTTQMAIGVVILVTGVVVLSVSRGGDIGGWQRHELLFPLVAAVWFAAGNVARRFGFTVSSTTTLQGIAIGETAALLFLLGYTLAAGRVADLHAPRRSHALFLASGLNAGLGLFMLFEGLRRGPVSVVDPVAGAAPLVTVVLAVVLLREFERITPLVVIGSVAIVIGAALIT